MHQEWLVAREIWLPWQRMNMSVTCLFLINSNEIHSVYAEKFAKSVQQISAYYVFRQKNNRHFSCCHGNMFFIKFQF